MVPPPLEDGKPYLCSRCLHLERVGRESLKPGTYRWYTGVVALITGFLGATSLLLAFSYLQGTGRALWFGLFVFVAVAFTAAGFLLVARKRNLSLIVGVLFSGVGVLGLVWSRSPGIIWSGDGALTWNSFMLLGVGVLSFFLYYRVQRRLPRA